jgi:hypothetical protein
MSTAHDRRSRRAALDAALDAQDGVASRRQLSSWGWTRWQERAELEADRWQSLGRQTVAVYTGPLPRRARWWAAVLEVGPRAVLAGVSALQAAGLSGVDEDAIHVAAPTSSRPRRPPGVRVHETRRLRPPDVAPAGLPRMRPAPAAVLAALWASSDRQAALYLVATVQQRLTTPEELARHVSRVRRHRRRHLLVAVAADIADGARALSELDFAGLCRSRGLPPPTRQSVVTTSQGRCYLDVTWDEWDLTAEIDGIQHTWVDVWLDDAWRRNDLVIDGRAVLRFPALAVRLDAARVLDQTEAGLRRAGWRPGRAGPAGGRRSRHAA